MTLVAFDVAADRLTMVTDSSIYSFEGEHTGINVKAVALPHIDAVAANVGDTRVIGMWTATMLTNVVGNDVDELAAASAMVLPSIWQSIVDSSGDVLNHSSFFLAGWSPRHERFLAYVFDAGDDFAEPVVIVDDLVVTPTTEGYRGPGQNVSSTWRPSSDEDWMKLATEARDQAAVRPAHRRVSIGGRVVVTSVQRGRVEQRTIGDLGTPTYVPMDEVLRALDLELTGALVVQALCRSWGGPETSSIELVSGAELVVA